MICSNESHDADKATRAPTLVYHSTQRDRHGRPVFYWWHCTKCNSTLASHRAPDVATAEAA